MKHGNFKFLPILFAAVVLLAASWALADTSLDPPHDSVATCGNCHNSALMAEPSYGYIDNSPYNNMCWGCHNSGYLGSRETHSSFETGSASKYGYAWTYECRNCHNPHYQRQMRLYPEDYPQGSTLFKGKIASVAGATTLVLNDINGNPITPSAGWTVNQWANHVILPNVNYPYFYKITSSTTNGQVTVSKTILTDYAWLKMVQPGDEFRIGYPRLISEEISTRRPVANLAGTTLDSNAWRPTKFFNSTGQYSLKSVPKAQQKGDMVCIVCHLKTTANNYAFTMFNSAYDYEIPDPNNAGQMLTKTVSEYVDHKISENKATCFSDTTNCHKEHSEGFKMATANCGDCHGKNMSVAENPNLVVNRKVSGSLVANTTGATSVWAHPVHLGSSVAQISCTNCHDDPVMTGTDDNTGDLFIKIGFKPDPDALPGYYYGRSAAVLNDDYGYDGFSVETAGPGPDGSMECRNLYCHSNAGEFDGSGFVYRTVAWSQPLVGLDCNDCHGNNSGDPNTRSTYVLTSMHPRHVANTTDNYDFQCNQCHDATVDSQTPPSVKTSPSNLHVDGVKNVVFSGGGTWTRSLNGECSNIYCHSAGTSPYAAPNTTPKWDGSGVWNRDCTDCHNAAGDGLSKTWSDPHNEHLEVYSGRFSCNACHNEVTGDGASISNTSLHVNQQKNVDINTTDYGSLALYNTSLPTDTCENVRCHSTGQPGIGEFVDATWNEGQGCDYCHAAALGTELDMSTDGHPLSGSHWAHVANGAGEYGYQARIANAITCGSCHSGTTDDGLNINANGRLANHVNFQNDVDFEFTSINATKTGLNYVQASMTCQNVYCHGYNMPYHSDTGGGGPGEKGRDIAPTWSNTDYIAGIDPVTDCNMCHGFPPKGYTVQGGQDSHTKNNVNGTTVQNCTSCHQHVKTSSPYFNDITKHINGIVEAADCEACHGQPPTSMANIVNSPDYSGMNAGAHQRHVDVGRADCDLCHKGGGGSGSHLLTPGPLANQITIGFANYLSGGAVYQGSTAIQNDFFINSGDPTNTHVDPPVDATRTCSNTYCHSTGAGTVGITTPDWDVPATGQCGECHGVNAATMPASPTHAAHLNSTAAGNSYMYTCDTCHDTIVTHTTNSTEAPTLQDDTLHVDVIKNVIFDPANGNIGGSANWTLSTGTCDTVYCHGFALPTYGGGGGGPNTDTAPTWSNTSYIDEAAAPDVRCGKCHGTPPNAGSSHQDPVPVLATDGCIGCHNHLNPISQWSTDGPWKDISLHINGKPDGGCTGCHGQPPVDAGTRIHTEYTLRDSQFSTEWGAHEKHYGYKTAFEDCYICHKGGGSEEPSHPTGGVGLEINIGFTYPAEADNLTANYSAPDIANTNYSLASGASTTVDNLAAARECSNIYCHSDGGNFDGSSFVYQTPDWDSQFISSYPTTCDQCHGDGTGSGNYVQSTKHPTHANQYGFACELCHNATVTGMNIIDNSIHVDGIKNVAFSSDSRTTGGTWTKSPNGQCSTIYCHSDGQTPVNYASPNWTGAGWNGDCSDCHAATPNTQNHGAHVGTTNYDYTCDLCHYETVDSGMSIINTSLHVNGIKNVDWGVINGFAAGGSDPYPGSSTACSNIYCHSQGTVMTPPYTDGGGLTNVTPNNNSSFSWDTAGSLGCGGCHDGTATGPDYLNGFPKANSHNAHVVNDGQLCIDCHNITVDGSNNIVAIGNHVDGHYDVANTTNFSGYTAGSKTCSSVTCHGGNNVTWGDTTLNCLSCHGTTGTETEDFGHGTAASIVNGVITATINETEWNTRGHGLDSGNLPSGNNPPNLLVGSSGTNKCWFCHSTSGHKDPANPFRLRGSMDNQVCLDCHGPSALGVDPDGGASEYGTKTSSISVGAAHYNGKHNTTYSGGEYCWNCHDPHGGPNNTYMMGIGPDERLTRKTGSFGIPADGTASIGDTAAKSRTATVVFTVNDSTNLPTKDDYATSGSFDNTKVCQTCHDSASGITVWAYGLAPATAYTDHFDSLCTGCHSHNSGFEGQADDSDGGQACGPCHSDLFDSDPAQASMHGFYLPSDGVTEAVRINYKHYMENAGTTYPTDTVGNAADDISYSSNTQNVTSRRCLMCHVDHDVFRSDLSGNLSPGRAYNMRTSIQYTPDRTKSPGDASGGRYTNTDFDKDQDDGGICMSCHFKARYKRIQTPNNATMTPPIPFPVNSGNEATDLVRAKELMVRSTHNYNVTGSIFNGPDGSESTQFQAVCLKCHNDSIGNNFGPKSSAKESGAQVTQGACYNSSGLQPSATTPYECSTISGGFWNGSPAFGRHISSNDSSMALMGTRYEQGTAGQASGDAYTLYRDTNLPPWEIDMWVGYNVIITNGKGEHSRALVIAQNNADYLTVKTAFNDIPDTTTQYDIVRSPLPQDELCFSCHTKVGNGKNYVGTDWYGQEPMKGILESIRAVFQAESNRSVITGTGGGNKRMVVLDTKNSWADSSIDPGASLKGYRFKWPGGSATIDSNIASTGTGPYTTEATMTVDVSVNDNDIYSIFKTASHPLDTFGRHRPYERVTAGEGWNMGDEGAATGGSTTTLTDTSKLWDATGSGQWSAASAGQQMYLYIVSVGDTGTVQNMGEKRPIQSNTADTITIDPTSVIDGQVWGPFPGAVTAEDTYYIGAKDDSRHVSCADCHNTHASTHNPEGTLSYDDANASGNSCSQNPANNNNTLCLTTSIAENEHWAVNEWKGFLIKLRKEYNGGANQGLEQIRFVTYFDPVAGRFDIATPWTVEPSASCDVSPGTYTTKELCEGAGGTWTGDTFELLMGDQWTPAGQDGGRAGSGSTGVWGVTPIADPTVKTNWPTPTPPNLSIGTEGNFSWNKVENVFDKKSPYIYGGSVDTGQRDLCVRCHSYYAYRQSPPNTPSGIPNVSGTELVYDAAPGTDLVAEFNPNNYAHHAVFARGNNQPIEEGANTYTQAQYYNSNWPLFTGTNTASTNSDSTTTGVVNLGVNLPDNILPGWILYLGSTSWPSANDGTPFFEVTTIVDRQTVTVKTAANLTNSQTNLSFFLTPGLGNAFVPPYGPWSILRCTDCHGSTKTDPIGPHASTNLWLIKSVDRELQFEWWQGTETPYSNATIIDPVNESAPNEQYVCFNCHRRDVYLDSVNYSSTATPTQMSRVPHGGDSTHMEGGHTQAANAATTGWPQHCRNCHGGDKLGGIHGTNLEQGTCIDKGKPIAGCTTDVGKRFLNGSAWGFGAGVTRATTSSAVTCYTGNTASTLDNCTTGHSNQAGGATAKYDY